MKTEKLIQMYLQERPMTSQFVFGGTYVQGFDFEQEDAKELKILEKDLSMFLQQDWINPESEQFAPLHKYLEKLRLYLGIKVSIEEFMADLRTGVKYDSEGFQIYSNAGGLHLDIRGLSSLEKRYGGNQEKAAQHIDKLGHWLTGLINREVQDEVKENTQEVKQWSVNIDGLRRQLYYKMFSLAKYLNQQQDAHGDIDVPSANIEDEVNELLSLVGQLACVFVPGQESFTDLSSELNDRFVFNDQD